MCLCVSMKMCIYVYSNIHIRLSIFIYIYIYILSSKAEYFVVSQLFSVARHAKCFKVSSWFRNPADFTSVGYLTLEPSLLSASEKMKINSKVIFKNKIFRGEVCL